MDRIEQISQLKKQAEEINQKIAELESVKTELCERTEHFISYTNSGSYVDTHYFKTDHLKNKALNRLAVYMKLLDLNCLYDTGYKFIHAKKNYFISYDFDSCNYFIDVDNICEGIGVVYFSSEETAKNALLMLEENNLT